MTSPVEPSLAGEKHEPQLVAILCQRAEIAVCAGIQINLRGQRGSDFPLGPQFLQTLLNPGTQLADMTPPRSQIAANSVLLRRQLVPRVQKDTVVVTARLAPPMLPWRLSSRIA